MIGLKGNRPLLLSVYNYFEALNIKIMILVWQSKNPDWLNELNCIGFMSMTNANIFTAF